MLQFIVNGLIAGSVYALVALGFALIYNTVRFFHFSHGAIYTIGAYLVFAAAFQWGWPFPLAVVAAVLGASLLGTGIGLWVYEPMRGRGAGPFVLLVASLGLFLALQNGVSLAFGDDVKTLNTGTAQAGYEIAGIRITGIQIAIVAVSLALFITTTLILQRTKTGRALRAVANDKNLAITVGIDSCRVIRSAYFIGSGLAAMAAILISLDLYMTPTMGFQAMLYGIVAMIVGGLGSPLGAYFGGILLGLTQNIGIWLFSSRWQDAIVFLVLIAFLLFRPQGLFGRRSRRGRA